MLEKEGKEYLNEDEKLNALLIFRIKLIILKENIMNKNQNNKDFLDKTIKNVKNLEEKFLKSDQLEKIKK